MISKHVPALRAALLSATLLGGLTAAAKADGTEFLGFVNPANVAQGSAVIIGGTGLGGPETYVPGQITIEVPAGVTVEQVLLYWQGFGKTAAEQGATDTIVLDNGGGPNLIEGDRIGGPTNFFFEAWSSTYRKDITALNLVTNGTNVIDVTDVDFQKANNGAGLLVIVDDGVNTTEIQLADGNDNAFILFAPPLDTTQPVTFNFAPASVERHGTLDMFFASIGPARPSVIEVKVDGVLSQQIIDELNDGEGPEFDVVEKDCIIPAGATSVTVQALSLDSGIGPFAGKLEASFTWCAASLALLPEETECTGRIGDIVWADMDCDGIQEEGETGLPGVTVILKDDQDVQLDSTVTDANGLYYFEGLCAGTYVVCVDETTLPEGYYAAPCEQGADPAVDSNCSPAMVVLPEDDSEDLTIDFGYCPPMGGGEGCTPGYWKQPQHFDSYPEGISPNDLFSAYFEDAFPGKTLVQVLSGRGGGLVALGRHTVAAFLNAHSDGVDYDLDPQDVVDKFNDVYPGSWMDYNDLKDEFEDFNELGCPLN